LKEWTYVCAPEKLECPHDQLNGGRTIKNVNVLMEEKSSKSANLIRAEIIGVVLYTGPMVISFILYCNVIEHGTAFADEKMHLLCCAY
jgi:hypothetical protein